MSGGGSHFKINIDYSDAALAAEAVSKSFRQMLNTAKQSKLDPLQIQILDTSQAISQIESVARSYQKVSREVKEQRKEVEAAMAKSAAFTLPHGANPTVKAAAQAEYNELLKKEGIEQGKLITLQDKKRALYNDFHNQRVSIQSDLKKVVNGRYESDFAKLEAQEYSDAWREAHALNSNREFIAAKQRKQSAQEYSKAWSEAHSINRNIDHVANAEKKRAAQEYSDAWREAHALNSNREFIAAKQRKQSAQEYSKAWSEAHSINRNMEEVARRKSQVFNQGRSNALLEGSINAHVESSQERINRLAADKARKSGDDLEKPHRALQKINTIMESLVIYHLAYRFFSQLSQAVNDAASLQVRVAEIATITQENPRTPTKEFLGQGTIAASIRQISSTRGFTQEDTAKALYEVVSNQVAKGADNITFLADAAGFAKASVSTLEQSVNLLSSALNAYNLNASHATEVSAQFFKVIDLGRVKASDLHSSMGPVLATAADLGISMEEVNAGIIGITQQGVKPNNAMTFMRNVILGLEKPSKEMQGIFNSWGTPTGEAAVATFGLVGVLEKLFEAAKGGNIELVDLFKNIRSLTGARLFAQGTTDMSKAKDNIKELNEAFDEFIRARDMVENNSGQKFQKAMIQYKNLFTDMGHVIVNTTAALGDWGAKLGLILASTGAGAILGGAMSGGNPIGLLLGAAIFGGTAAYSVTRGKSYQTEVAEDTIKNSRASEKALHDFNLKQKLDAEAVNEVYKEGLEAQAEAIKGQEDVVFKMEHAYKNIFQSINREMDKTTEKINDQKTAINRLIDLQASFRNAQSDRAIGDLPDYQQPSAQFYVARQRYQAAFRAAGNGEVELARKLFGESQQYLNQSFQGAKQFPGRYGINDRRQWEMANEQLNTAQQQLERNIAVGNYNKYRLAHEARAKGLKIPIDMLPGGAIEALTDEAKGLEAIKEVNSNIRSILKDQTISEERKRELIQDQLNNLGDIENGTSRILQLEVPLLQGLNAQIEAQEQLNASKKRQADMTAEMNKTDNALKNNPGGELIVKRGQLDASLNVKGTTYEDYNIWKGFLTNISPNERKRLEEKYSQESAGKARLDSLEKLKAFDFDPYTYNYIAQTGGLDDSRIKINTMIEATKKVSGDKYISRLNELNSNLKTYEDQINEAVKGGIIGQASGADTITNIQAMRNSIDNYLQTDFEYIAGLHNTAVRGSNVGVPSNTPSTIINDGSDRSIQIIIQGSGISQKDIPELERILNNIQQRNRNQGIVPGNYAPATAGSVPQ